MVVQECAVVVLGGGISGLTAKYMLQKLSPISVKLFEASSRFGGWIRSEVVDGFLFERGPHTLRVGDESDDVRNFLFDDLNLASKITTVKSRKPLIMHNKKICTLYSVPLNKPFLYYPLRNFFSMKKNFFTEDVSVRTFIEKVFDSSVADNLVDPLFRGIFGTLPIDQLSAECCLSELFKCQNRHGSFIRTFLIRKLMKRGKKINVVYVKDGLEQVIKSIVEKSDDLFLNEPCGSLEFENDMWTVHTKNKSVRTKHLISAIPAPNLSTILPVKFHDLKLNLSKFRFSPLGLIQFVFKEKNNDVTQYVPKDAFGYLLSSNEHKHIMGVIFDSNIQSLDDGNLAISVFIDYKDINFHDEKELSEYTLNEIKKQIPIGTNPIHSLVTLADNSAPVYGIGHMKLCESVEKSIVDNKIPLTLLGASYGSSGVPTLIRRSQNKVKQFLTSFKQN